MAMNNKQRWMGGVVLLGGGALLAALLLKGQGEQALIPQRTSNPSVSITQPSQQIDNSDRMHPLALDIETERQLLEKQRAQREKMVAEQEAKTAEYLALQQKAEADAAKRAAEEYAAQLAKRQNKLDEQAMSSDSLPPELVDDVQQKNATQRAEIEKLAAQANVRADAAQKASVDAEKAAVAASAKLDKVRAEKEALQKAQAAKVEKERLLLEAKQKADREAKKKEQEMLAKQKLEDEAKRKKEQELQAKQKAEQDAKQKKEQEAAEKRKAEELAKQKKEDELAAKRKAEEDKKKQEQEDKAKKDKLDKEAAARKANSKAETDAQVANKKLEEERGRAILEGDNKPWMVQVAIASNQANADAVVAKLRAKGYKVKTSQTTKGVRVMVGPEKGRAAADALRNQVSKEDSLNAKGAWVIDWQPPE